jgi:hypothetical protein
MMRGGARPFVLPELTSSVAVNSHGRLSSTVNKPFPVWKMSSNTHAMNIVD